MRTPDYKFWAGMGVALVSLAPEIPEWLRILLALLGGALILVSVTGHGISALIRRHAIDRLGDRQKSETALQSRRDVSVGEAIAYLCFCEWGRRFVDAAASPDVSGNLEHTQFQQAAADGDVRIWGRPSAGRVYEPIPKEYWRENRIEWFSLLKGEPDTEPLGRAKETGPLQRYNSLMTSRSDTERLFQAQSAEMLRAKSLWSRFAKVLGDGIAQRNQILEPLDDSEAEYHEAILVEWDGKFQSGLHEAGLTQDDMESFAEDPFGRSLMGSADRAEWQAQLEESWNDRLRVLRLVMQRVHDLAIHRA
jgi:hypothetical protein